MPRPSVVIVSPAAADANNGNARTAARWAAALGPAHSVRIVRDWPDAQAAHDQVMLALHARRSARAIASWGRHNPGRGLALVLTGTDLYGDFAADRLARESARLAQRLVVLQELGLARLPPNLREKAQVIHQSTTRLEPLAKGRRELRVLAVGHLREVKSPQTLFEAARLLDRACGIRISHVGAATSARWERRARQVEHECPHYRWLGELSHARVRRAIQHAHVLVHPSAAEGGAHVVMEAVCSGTPVLASRVDGNVGMLGDAYAGYFAHGDSRALASLLLRCRHEQRHPPGFGPRLLDALAAQCARRAALFSPRAERSRLLRLVRELA